jgi:hypothetical protein
VNSALPSLLATPTFQPPVWRPQNADLELREGEWLLLSCAGFHSPNFPCAFPVTGKPFASANFLPALCAPNRPFAVTSPSDHAYTAPSISLSSLLCAMSQLLFCSNFAFLCSSVSCRGLIHHYMPLHRSLPYLLLPRGGS